MSERVRFDFSGCRVLVTGGSNGIGAGIAAAFRAAGAEVSITGRREKASDYDADLSAYDYHRLEMTDREGIRAVASSLPALDVLVNNAGGSLVIRDESIPEVFEEAVAMHLFGAYRLAVACEGHLAASRIEGGGSVVNMGSMSAFFGIPLAMGYGAGKAGVVQMTKTLAVAWAARGIRVNAVAPGLIESNMTARVKGVEELERPQLERTPMRRWGTAEDVAPAVLFLASPAARFITGQTLCIDGGFSIA